MSARMPVIPMPAGATSSSPSGGETRYVTLVCALPALPARLDVTITPLSRIALDRRLTMLEAGDAARLAALEAVLGWDRYRLDDTDAVIAARWARAEEAVSDSETLSTMLRWRRDLRAVVAALRRRRAGEAAPARPDLVATAPSGLTIRANWRLPDLGLSRLHPWLPEAERLLQAGDPLGLERHLLEVVYEKTGRWAAEHPFDFEAIALYVLRWSALERWTGRQPEAAITRFGRLLDAALVTPPSEPLRHG